MCGCYEGSEESETQTGLRLDLKWLLAVLSSTLIWDVVMCYLVICGLISGFWGYAGLKNLHSSSLSVLISPLSVSTDWHMYQHMRAHSPTLKL